MHIIKQPPNSTPSTATVDALENNFYRTTANISDGVTTISRIMYFEADSAQEDAADIVALTYFPAKYSAHPLHAQFKYYGNATIEPLSSQSKIWKATLEYSTSSTANLTDKNGNAITGTTAPWSLPPDNLTFSYPEVTVPFKTAYDTNGKLTVPVTNSAGNILAATKSLFYTKMSFTFATQTWSTGNALTYGNTLNSSSQKVCGTTLKAKTALLLPPEATKVTVYQDGTSTVKWSYWNVSVSILIDTTGTLFPRKLLNIGDMACFSALDLAEDALLQQAGMTRSIPATNFASQICSFRLTQAVTIGGKTDYYPTGKLVFCSWEQFVSARKLYMDASVKLKDKMSTIYQLQCEQHQSMPLDTTGKVLTAALKGHPDYTAGTEYISLSFDQYPAKSWSSLNLPS